MILRHQLDTLTVFDPDRSSSTVNVWVAHPSPSEEQSFGTLFVVSAIDAAGRAHHEVLNLLQEELKHQYYQGANPTVELAFEHALQKTNQRLHQLIREGVAGWVDHAHIVIGVQWRDRLLLTALGPMHVFLIRRDRLHDILDQSVTAKPNPLRLFDQLVAGQLQPEDRILVCTPALLDYFSLEKLRRTILDHSPSQATRVLETSLLGVEARVAFAALVMSLHLDAQPTPVAIPMVMGSSPVRPAPQLSMDQLRHRERNTEQLLSPSIWPAIKDAGQQVIQAVSQTTRRLTRQPNKRTLPREAQVRREPSPSRVARRPSIPFRQTIQSLSTKLRSSLPSGPLGSALPSAPRRPVRLSFSPSAWLNALVLWFQRLPRRQQLSVMGASFLILVLSTVLVQSAAPGASLPGNDADALAQSIEDRLTQAEAALLFGGEDLAQDHLESAQALIDDLPSRSKADRQRRDPLVAKLNELQSRMTRLTVIGNPTILTRLGTNFPDVQPQQLYQVGQRMIAYDPAQQTALVTNLDAPAEVVSSSNSLDTGTPRTGTVANAVLLFATDRNGFMAFDPGSREWRPMDARLPDTSTYLQSVSFFQNRVYVLDTRNQKIVRFSFSTNSLGSGQSWLTTPAPLDRARGLVVDGSIYVLQPEGKVEKYFGGRPAEFTLETISPALTNPTRLWTNEPSDHIYLVEPRTRRMIVFDKEGQLLSQYQSNRWTNLRDVIADESKKTAYVLDGTTIFTVPLP